MYPLKLFRFVAFIGLLEQVNSYKFYGVSNLEKSNQATLLDRNRGSFTEQCPNVRSQDSDDYSKKRTDITPSKQVEVDPSSGRRHFNARIIGIFSCLDGERIAEQNTTAINANGTVFQSASTDLTQIDFRLAKPVIDLAIERVHGKYENIRFNVSYRTIAGGSAGGPHTCDEYQSSKELVGQAADEYYLNGGVDFLIGATGGCGDSLASVSQLASYWNVPMCTTGYLPELLTSRLKPLTLMQLSLSVQSVGEMLLELFQLYKWRHLVIVTDQRHPLHSLIRDGLLEYFRTIYSQQQQIDMQLQASNLNEQSKFQSDSKQQKQMNGGKQRRPYYINITVSNFDAKSQSSTATSGPFDVNFDQVMLDAAISSRIMLLLARSSTVGHLLEAAHRQGMSKGNQFVFIAHELFETHALMEPRHYVRAPHLHNLPRLKLQATRETGTNSSADKLFSRWDDKIEIQLSRDKSLGGREQLIREVYQPLMTISMKIPTTNEFNLFRRRVVELSKEEFNYNLKSDNTNSMYSLGIAAVIFDCVMLYADKVDYILKHTDLSMIDGKTVLELAAGKTFTSALTGDLILNKAGQRVIDFTLNDFSIESLTLEPLAHFIAIERQLKFLPNKKPHWFHQNQTSIPRSDPRLLCRGSRYENEKYPYCEHFAGMNLNNFNEEDLAYLWDELQTGQYDLSSDPKDRSILGVWLLISIILTVAITSSGIGWFIYRRFRIESELLNLWWSIKYEDIQFDEDEDLYSGQMVGDYGSSKHSMSSLALSNESFNNATAPASNTQHKTFLEPPNYKANSRTGRLSDIDGGGKQVQLNINQPISPLEASKLYPREQHQLQPFDYGASRSSGGKTNTSNHNGSKLLPLISRAATPKGSVGSRADDLDGSQGASELARVPGCTLTASGATRDPSISSQNKNHRLRLGTILNSTAIDNRRKAINKSTDSTKQPDLMATTKIGLYKGSKIVAKHLNIKHLSINRQLLIELRQVRDLTHENLIKFIGLCPEEPNVAIISELCTRGNLKDLLQSDTIRLDWPFRFSIINDIVDGLLHLHSSPVQYHGRLKSTNCVIDNRFVVKLTDFGLPTLMTAVEMNRYQSSSDGSDNNIDDCNNNGTNCSGQTNPVDPRLLLWTAPEHLRTKYPLSSGSQKGDIYSLAIIFQEIITRCGPFECEPLFCGSSGLIGASVEPPDQRKLLIGAPLLQGTAMAQSSGGGLIRRGTGRKNNSGPSNSNIITQPVVVQHKQRLEPGEIVNLARMGLSPPFRPYFRPNAIVAGINTTDTILSSSIGTQGQQQNTGTDFDVNELISIVQSCWVESPQTRPTIVSVKQQLKRMRRDCHLDGSNLMDNLLKRVERYTDNLESLVDQKTSELMEEKKRSEELLYEMLPRFVVDQLKYGHSVTPEAYEAVTICFSDIKDFTSIAARSSPIEVVNLLNHLYTEFDDCIARYDVYKVETIGDAYMVVSGLPITNGDLHAKEIAEMSLALLELINHFRVPHLPEVNLELRIGIHSGPCASGVVGTRMFRYCLFGDTVNTASRMESHGEPMKIHISEDTANILERFNEFIIKPRGEVDIKGKGIMNTYWLIAKKFVSKIDI